MLKIENIFVIRFNYHLATYTHIHIHLRRSFTTQCVLIFVRQIFFMIQFSSYHFIIQTSNTLFMDINWLSRPFPKWIYGSMMSLPSFHGLYNILFECLENRTLMVTKRYCMRICNWILCWILSWQQLLLAYKSFTNFLLNSSEKETFTLKFVTTGYPNDSRINGILSNFLVESVEKLRLLMTFIDVSFEWFSFYEKILFKILLHIISCHETMLSYQQSPNETSSSSSRKLVGFISHLLM